MLLSLWITTTTSCCHHTRTTHVENLWKLVLWRVNDSPNHDSSSGMAVCSGLLSASWCWCFMSKKKCFNNISPLPNTEAQWSNKLSKDTMGHDGGVTKSTMLISVGGSNDRLVVMEELVSNSRPKHSSGYTAVDVWCDLACWFAVGQTMGGRPQMGLSTIAAVATARLSLRPLVYGSFTTEHISTAILLQGCSLTLLL